MLQYWKWKTKEKKVYYNIQGFLSLVFLFMQKVVEKSKIKKICFKEQSRRKKIKNVIRF